jgi:2-polyprenyl-3-methyl-5-hydroxy-6-metoxy-1,4-benzoquinol methylase
MTTLEPEENSPKISLECAVNKALGVIGSKTEYPNSFYPRSSGRFWPVWRDLAKMPSGRLLDVGCGVGFMSSVVSQLGYEMHCIDASNDINQEAISTFSLRFSECNIEFSPIPYDDNYFDIVILTEVLEHFNYSPLVPLKQIQRVLKPGGLLLLTTPDITGIFSLYTLLKGDNVSGSLNMMLEQTRVWSPDNGQNQLFRDIHFRCYTIKEIRKLMDMTGFTIIKYRSLVRGEPSTRNIPRRLFLYLAKMMVQITNSRFWGDTIYIIARKGVV